MVVSEHSESDSRVSNETAMNEAVPALKRAKVINYDDWPDSESHSHFSYPVSGSSTPVECVRLPPLAAVVDLA